MILAEFGGETGSLIATIVITAGTIIWKMGSMHRDLMIDRKNNHVEHRRFRKRIRTHGVLLDQHGNRIKAVEDHPAIRAHRHESTGL